MTDNEKGILLKELRISIIYNSLTKTIFLVPIAFLIMTIIFKNSLIENVVGIILTAILIVIEIVMFIALVIINKKIIKLDKCILENQDNKANELNSIKSVREKIIEDGSFNFNKEKYMCIIVP